MDYQEKLIKLFTSCLRDEKFYGTMTAQDYQGRDYQKDLISFNDGSDYNYPCIYKYQEYYYVESPNYEFSQKIKRKYKDINESIDSKEKLYSINIYFEDQPPLSLSYSPSKELKEEIVTTYSTRKFWGIFGKKYEVVVKVIKTFYTPKFKITHGSLEVEISKDKAKLFYDLANEKRNKFQQLKDIAKLDKRLKAYG